MIVGLTGGIGSGKSAAAKIFVELGIDVIDADELSKNVLIENQKAKKIFVEKFGQKYINSNDEIDRELLSCLLYTSPSPRDNSGSRMPSAA